MTRRSWLTLGLVLTAPPALLGLFFLLFIFNPLGAAFISSFQIENKTSHAIWVTPIGSTQGGKRAVLPQYLLPFPLIPALQTTRFKLEPGERVTIRYDWDDVNFRAILIDDGGGRVLELATDLFPGPGYRPNEKTAYVIDDLSSLPVSASADLSDSRPMGFRFWGLSLTGMFGLIAHAAIHTLRRRTR